MLIATVIIVFLASIAAWFLIKLLVVWHILKSAIQKNWGKAWDIFLQYLTRKADAKIFKSYLSAMVGVCGVLPTILSVGFKYLSHDVNISLVGTLQDNHSWESFGLGVLITIGYYMFLRHKERPNKAQWLQLVSSSKLINDNLSFEPNGDWFESQNRKAIKALGRRYSRQLNVPIKSMPYLKAAMDNDKRAIYGLLESHFTNLVKAYRKADSIIKEHYGDEAKDTISKEIDNIYSLITDLDSNKVSQIISSIDGIEQKLASPIQKSQADRSATKDGTVIIADLRESLWSFKNELNKTWLTMIGKRVFFIIGKAGIGKSHFLGELVTQRNKASLPNILLLGQQFSDTSDPLSQILALLDIKCKKEIFLKSLQKLGEIQNHKVLIVIDGLNEGAGMQYWLNHLQSLCATIDEYSYINLVFSVRTTTSSSWVKEFKEISGSCIYEHKGFSENENQAVEYIFKSFGLKPPSWPIYGEEFSNPLFLTQYCRIHQLNQKPLEFEDFWTIITEYCSYVNDDLANKLDYDRNTNLVFSSLLKVAELMVSMGRWNLTYDTALQQITQEASLTSKPQLFLSYLINEGLLRTEIVGGITYVEFEFERFGDYFIVFYLVNSNKLNAWLSKTLRLENYGEALTILVPKLTGKEIYQVVPLQNQEEAFSNFIEYLPWRTDVTDDGIQKINEIVGNNLNAALYISVSCVYKKQFSFNGNLLTKTLEAMSLSERDQKWTIGISEYADELYTMLLNLSDWGQLLSAEMSQSLDEETVWLCCQGLVWALSSTNKRLRDKSTHALVNLLEWKPVNLCKLLEKFTKVNDPYIIERLYLVAFGVILKCQDDIYITQIAETVYNVLFKNGNVIEDIRVRDNALGIIEYAQYKIPSFSIDRNKITLPLGNSQLPSFLTIDQIDSLYRKDLNQAKDQKENEEYMAQNRILFSMAVEHSSRKNMSMYGDFGRYVFQSALDVFPENIEDLSNWAIQIIFQELGYDSKLFAKFDNLHTDYTSGSKDIERIGKKYQWIAMYKIAAILTDLHPDLKFEDNWRNPHLLFRGLDPTINPAYTAIAKHHPIYEVPTYNVRAIGDNLKWLKSYKSMPSIDQYIQVKDSDGHEWIDLYSSNMISIKPSNPQKVDYNRDLWVFIQAYLVEQKDIKKVCKEIYNVGIEGRSFHENGSIYNIYNREFYWSSIFKDNVEIDDTYRHIQFSVGKHYFPNIVIEPTYLQYIEEEDEDHSCDNGVSMIMPNTCLVEGLKLRFAQDDGVWTDTNGDLICFDNRVYGGGHSALLIKKEKILGLLKKENKVLLWPILIERMLRTEAGSGSLRQQSGGYAYMDENGDIHKKIRPYAISYFQKFINKQKGRITKYRNTARHFLIKHKLLKPNLYDLAMMKLKDADSLYKLPHDIDTLVDTSHLNSDNK